MKVKSVRTIWISDLHLGNKDCKAAYLLDFLKNHDAETIVLVGDIIDLWSLSSSHYWPESHNQVISALLERAHNGCRLVYVPGNHDASVRNFVKFDFGKVEVRSRYTHTSAAGKKILAMHGDEFDTAVCHSRLTSIAGDVGYDLLLFINRWWTRMRNKMGFSYWSLATYIKSKVKTANIAISRFENAVAQFGRKKGVDAIVCGHIHHPAVKMMDDILYLNDGDWIENCTALVEDFDGHIQLLRWTETCSVLINAPQLANQSVKKHADKAA
ncbi:UDP-2,3-diacylglucosamine diphosphatase [Veronia pacifica]|uniref:UDP-2,3-diacylglucosamine hydrolase n=1 Tax=Veronia pacifica TaxID=1080227 RepID=A0A1C3EDZ9_9GAMM|nr:UDP-2,3-diacylglucosamine diphosphatase [Veronia pacifica]ODA31468.1 UDP-2,3-diacylglucosamine hydrolase [Veronia pacifica]